MEVSKIEGEKIFEQRQKKVLGLFKKWNLWVIGILIVALILGGYIRSLPMSDHNGNPGLWDITTDSWTLGPDLDPFLFLRYAKTIVSEGSLPSTDEMRNFPLGFDTSTELQMVSYMIVLTYKFLNIFSDVSVDYAGVVMPLIMFLLTIISFFLFVREVFVRKNEKTTKANAIALISTFFMIVIPIFLSRTIAGIPEKESVAFFFIFLTFYLFLKAWKSPSLRSSIALGILAGISTGLTALAWGGVSYVYATIAIAGMIGFLLNKFEKKETLIYALWLVVSFVITFLFTNRFSVKGWATSLDTGLALLILIVLGVHQVIWKTELRNVKFIENSKLPKNILSLIAGILLVLVLMTVLFGPGVIIEKAQAVNQMMFRPITGRWSTTVAENRQPYFTEWSSSFGPVIQGVPLLFWLFFIGSVFLFRKIFSHIRKKDAWILTIFYVLFFFGLVFSRYAPHPSVLDGENLLSKSLYYGFALLLIGGLIYYYSKYKREKIEGFDKIEFEYLFLFALFALSLFTARSAVRLIMVLGPIAPIFLAYLVVESVSALIKNKNDENKKIFYGVVSLVLVILSLYIFWSYYSEVKSQAYNFVPSVYTQQWQKAMAWTRVNTPEDSVFVHWWDYGYWLQSIGNRATVTDGGNVITYWNYLTGRYLLTGDNQRDALELLYNHEVDYLLIDSSDIGKYGAYSSIGSDENYDRASWIPVMGSDSSQMQETRTGMMRVYSGASGIDEDIVYNVNGSRTFLPAEKTALIAILSESSSSENKTIYQQPEAVYYYNGEQIRLPLRYIYDGENFKDFGQGVEAAAFIVTRLGQGSQGLQIDLQGAVIYISPRVLRGMMAQVYLLDDPFNKFPNFKLAHSEQSILYDSLKSQGADVGDFIVYGDIYGPIKIWKVEYTGTETLKEEYIDTDPSKYLSWQL